MVCSEFGFRFSYTDVCCHQLDKTRKLQHSFYLFLLLLIIIISTYLNEVKTKAYINLL